MTLRRGDALQAGRHTTISLQDQRQRQDLDEVINGIPETEYTRVIREDPNRRGLLHAGTETGIYVSFDDGDQWQPLAAESAIRGVTGLPVCPIHDLVVKGTDLVVATHGRSFWILDDLTPLHQMTDENHGASVTLFQPRPTYRFRYNSLLDSHHDELTSYRMVGPVTVSYQVLRHADGTTCLAFLNAGKNPPDGVIVHFYLPEVRYGVVTLVFRDAEGQVIRTFSTASEDEPTKLPVKAGANRFVWNMRYPPATKLEDEKKDMFANIFGEAPTPKALPGAYRVELRAGDQLFAQPFEILADPRVPASADDLRQQFDLLTSIRDTVSEVNAALNRLRHRRAQLELWSERSAASRESHGITEHAVSLASKLSQVEGELLQVMADSPLVYPNRLREKLLSLARVVDSADAAPTRQAGEVYQHLAQQVDEQLAWIEEHVEPDLDTFNQRIREAGLVPVDA